MAEHSEDFSVFRDRDARRVILLGGLLHLLFVVLALRFSHGNFSYFVHFGREDRSVLVARSITPPILMPHTDGHDGQRFWVQAHDPLLRNPAFAISYQDRPVYRSQRVLYPLLASPFRLFGEQGLFVGLVLLNLAFVLVGGAATASLAQSLGWPVRAALSFALNPAVVLSTAMDLSDGMALALVLSTIALTLRGKDRLALTCAVAAVLAKETSLLAFFGFAFFAPRLSRRARIRLVFLPALAAGVFGLYVRARLGFAPTNVRELGAPFVGFARSFSAPSGLGEVLDMGLVAGCFVAASLVLARWLRHRSWVLGIALPYVVLAPFLSRAVLDLLTNSLRAFGPLFAFLVLDLYAQGQAGRANGVAADR